MRNTEKELLEFLVERYTKGLECEGITVRELSQKLKQSPATIRNLLNSLEEMGFIVDKGHRKNRQISLNYDYYLTWKKTYKRVDGRYLAIADMFCNAWWLKCHYKKKIGKTEIAEDLQRMENENWGGSQNDFIKVLQWYCNNWRRWGRGLPACHNAKQIDAGIIWILEVYQRENSIELGSLDPKLEKEAMKFLSNSSLAGVVEVEGLTRMFMVVDKWKIATMKIVNELQDIVNQPDEFGNYYRIVRSYDHPVIGDCAGLCPLNLRMIVGGNLVTSFWLFLVGFTAGWENWRGSFEKFMPGERYFMEFLEWRSQDCTDAPLQKSEKRLFEKVSQLLFEMNCEA